MKPLFDCFRNNDDGDSMYEEIDTDKDGSYVIDVYVSDEDRGYIEFT